MHYDNLTDGLFRFNHGSSLRDFRFLNGFSFRLFDVNAPKSFCASSPNHVKADMTTALSDGIRFQKGDLEVFVKEDGSLQIVYRGSSVLNLRSLLPVEGHERLELLEKEGHRANFGEGYRAGIEIDNDRPVYGLGERTGPLDKRGYSYINWNTDDPSAHVDTFPSLYQSIPFFVLFSPDVSVGIFLDNSSKTRFDINKTDPKTIRVEFEEPYLDLYVFVGSLPEVIANYTSLSGRNPLVPYWALGAQQSRWSYGSAEIVDQVIEGYRKADIPLSCVYLDIDYMDHYKDFSVNETTYPNVRDWIASKNEEGVRIVPIIDAGVKAEEGYDVYDEGMANQCFCTQNGNVYHNEVWPGDSVFPAFLDEKVQQWWADHIAKMLDLGFAGIWNDMNEPASFRGPLPLDVEMGQGIPHRLAHNVYGHHMVKAGALGFEKAGKRLFQLTRAGYAGTCRYSGTWAGDNQSIYDHLRLSLPQLMNMSLSGQAYIGVDIGGFGGDSTPELLVRWAIASLFNPLYRNHSALGTKDQEPYRLNGVDLENYRRAVMTRYEILPTLYDQLYFAETRGSIPLRPLIYNYPKDARAINENTEIMLGEDLLLAPSLFPGQNVRSCYFPEPFFDYRSGERFEKGDALISVSMDQIPLFVREGSLIALAPKGNKEAKPQETLCLLATDDSCECIHYEDDGDGVDYQTGRYNLYAIKVVGQEVTLRYLHQGMPTNYRRIELRRFGKEPLEFPFAAKE